MSNTNVDQSRLPAKSFLQIIQDTPPAQIAELDIVRDKYIQNYNACNREKVGELMYHRQLVHFKQIVSSNFQFSKCDSFSLYACFVTAAANGYSLDPQDNEVYLIPRGGKACLDRQASSHVRRLIRTGQIQLADQAKIVYQGDEFEVLNGRVLRHIEKYQSDNMIAVYVRMVIDDKGGDRFFVYRRSDWESWRKKSPNPKTYEKVGSRGPYLSESPWDDGVIGGTNPEAGFLRTKVIKHACNEKCWASGTRPAFVENYEDVLIETEEDGSQTENTPYTLADPTPAAPQATTPVQTTAAPVADDSFVAPAKEAPAKTLSFDDDNF